MTTPFDPTPRPALRKAADADIHPTTNSPLTTTTTGEAIIGGKEVDLTVRIPKKLRKQLKKVASKGGLTVDEIVTIAIAAEVQRRSD